MQLPKFVSVVAFLLGAFDLVRALSHTFLAVDISVNLVGLDLAGDTGRDQITIMVAFGASNIVTGCMLIYLALRDRFGALLMLAVMPVAYLLARLALEHVGQGLVGQGVFPGRYVMSVYLTISIATVGVALIWRRSAPQEAHL